MGEATGAMMPVIGTDKLPTEKPIIDLSALKAEDVISGTGAASKVARGAVKGAETFGSSLTTPLNASILAGTAGLSEALPIVSRLLSAGFSIQMLKGAFDRSPELASRVKSGDYEGAAQALTEMGLGAAAGVLSAKHAINGGMPTVASADHEMAETPTAETPATEIPEVERNDGWEPVEARPSPQKTPPTPVWEPWEPMASRPDHSVNIAPEQQQTAAPQAQEQSHSTTVENTPTAESKPTVDVSPVPQTPTAPTAIPQSAIPPFPATAQGEASPQHTAKLEQDANAIVPSLTPVVNAAEPPAVTAGSPIENPSAPETTREQPVAAQTAALNPEHVSNIADSLRSNDYYDVLRGESIGGNAGKDSAGVNAYIDKDSGSIAAFGNPQNTSGEIKNNPQYREVTFRHTYAPGSPGGTISGIYGTEGLTDQVVKNLHAGIAEANSRPADQTRTDIPLKAPESAQPAAPAAALTPEPLSEKSIQTSGKPDLRPQIREAIDKAKSLQAQARSMQNSSERERLADSAFEWMKKAEEGQKEQVANQKAKVEAAVPATPEAKPERKYGEMQKLEPMARPAKAPNRAPIEEPKAEVQSDNGKGTEARGNDQGRTVPEPRSPGHPVARGAETVVEVEGRDRPYKAQYTVRELSDTYPSHNPFTFEPNPAYHYINDRDYQLPENRVRVTAGTLKPHRVINDNPDATNGPSVIESQGNVLGGNNRRMRIERAYSADPKGGQGYKQYLIDKARNFGLDPVAISKMNKPVLDRELDESELDPQRVITDLNKTPTAELSTGEQAAADARGLTPEMSKYIGAVLEGAGPDATLTEVLNGKRGPEGLKPGESFLIKNPESAHHGSREYQAGMFGETPKPPIATDQSAALADFIRRNSPTSVARAFRSYAEKSTESGLFGQADPKDAFEDSFGPKDQSGNAALPNGNAARGQTIRATPPQKPATTPPAAVTRTPAQVGARFAGLKDAMLKLVSPSARTEGARQTSYVMREMGAKLAREDDIAQDALRSAHKMFAAEKPTANYEFIDRVENGQKQTTLPKQQIADTMRSMLDEARDSIRAMGTDHLQKFYENYFPHMWKDPKKAQDVMGQFFEKRPLQGSKSFLKQRTLPTFADGLARGLEPISDNPADLVLAKIHEMAKYRLAHQAMDEMKERGLLEYFSATTKAPAGYKKIDDSIATVYGKPTVTVQESYDQPLMDRLNSFANSIGINHQRNVRLKGAGIPRGALGFASKSGDVQTKFGSPESVLAHEIGHQIEYKYGISQALKGPGIAKELNDLSALRWEDQTPTASYKSYARGTDEKMANAIAAMIYAPERFKEVAPKTWDLLRDELYSHPELRPLFDVKKSMTLGTNEAEVPVGGMVIRGHYWAPEDRATVVNNFLSPGLRGNPIYDAYMAAGNTLNQANLGFSAFHLGTTVAEAMIASDAMAVRRLAENQKADAIKSHLNAYVAPFTYAVQGNKMLREWTRPGTQGGDFSALVDAAIKAGARARQDKFYETGQADKFADAIRRGGLGGYAEAALRGLPALADLSSRPLMHYLVPRIKMGAFADIARFEMAKLPEGATAKDAQGALSRAWDSIDNRMGQMTYDNLFWNKVAKDMAMASVRAVGWDVGSLREALGGIKDVSLGNSAGERVTNRSAYLAAAVVRTGIMGAMAYYLLNGQPPKTIKDYFFPGGHSMAGFLKDGVNYATHPIDTAKGKIHPLLSLMYDMLSNEDYYGHAITTEDWNDAQHWLDYGKFIGKEAMPISIKNVIDGEAPSEDDVFQFFGMPKEPRAVRDEE